MQFVLRQMERVRSEAALIVGGDFNAQPADGALQPLHQRLADSFRTAGAGWGKTAMNGLPVIRIDQIWCSRHFTVDSTVAKHTRFSDHRMVVSDLIFRQ